ncbi:MAG: hypothetical protein AB1498_00095 [bacterium]
MAERFFCGLGTNPENSSYIKSLSDKLKIKEIESENGTGVSIFYDFGQN